MKFNKTILALAVTIATNAFALGGNGQIYTVQPSSIRVSVEDRWFPDINRLKMYINGKEVYEATSDSLEDLEEIKNSLLLKIKDTAALSPSSHVVVDLSKGEGMRYESDLMQAIKVHQ